MATKKIMIVPWAEKICWKWSDDKKPWLEPTETACWARIIPASARPRSSMTRATMMYMTPIFLGSSDVSHSFQSHFQRLK